MAKPPVSFERLTPMLRTKDDVSALWHALASRAEVCCPIEDFDYGMREFAIYDNNGYLLQFGTPLGS